MSENIKSYSKTYTMSDELKRFFSEITNREALQQQLYITEKVSDVATIAKQLGFDIKAGEILQAQAGRVLAILDEQSDDVQNLLSGKKPKTGAQWGRGGGGYLDKAGYWLHELATKDALTEVEQAINDFLVQSEQEATLRDQLLNAHTYNELAQLFQSQGVTIAATDLLMHQAQKILALSEDSADEIACF